MHEHIKPDANLVIGNYEPMHRGNNTIGSFIASRHIRFGPGISRFKMDRRAEKAGRAECRVRLREPGPNQWGENEPYSNRGVISLELGIVRLELKYCERCGGLWTREHGVLQSRCERCMAEEKQLTKLWRARSNRFNRSARLAGFGNEPTTIPGGLPA